jgi:hypothetical protein
MPEPSDAFSLPRARPCSAVGSHCFQEVRKCPPETARRRSCAVCGATIAVGHNGPHLVARLGPPPLRVRPLRQRAMTPCDGGGGTLQGLPLPRGPGVPVPKGRRGKTLGEGLGGTGGVDTLQGPRPLGFPPGATRARPLGLPRHLRHQRLWCPLPPAGGDGSGLQGLPPPCPPAVPAGGQGGDVLFDLRLGGRPRWPLRGLCLRFTHPVTNNR